ncbi:MAG: transposase zinc-binding domain-containing protein [Sedimenticola sp.]
MSRSGSCARAYCDECGEDFLIAYSCKGRGICPSCGNLFASVWAMLLARIYEINSLVCLRCGGEMRIIALTYRDVLMLREACLQGCR